MKCQGRYYCEDDDLQMFFCLCKTNL